jgi:hypothetical protein
MISIVTLKCVRDKAFFEIMCYKNTIYEMFLRIVKILEEVARHYISIDHVHMD